MDLNRVVFTGRLTSDPELRALPSGTAVCSLRVACNSLRKDKDGAVVNKPNYLTVSVFGASGESAHRYLSKGRRVGIDGRLDWREWDTADGKRSTIEIVADSVQFLSDSPANSTAGETDSDDSPSVTALEPQPAAPKRNSRRKAAAAA